MGQVTYDSAYVKRLLIATVCLGGFIFVIDLLADWHWWAALILLLVVEIFLVVSAVARSRKLNAHRRLGGLLDSLDDESGPPNAEMLAKARSLFTPIYTDERATKNPFRPYDWEVECPDLLD